jgi:membrane-associated phospholipid phosphatase
MKLSKALGLPAAMLVAAVALQASPLNKDFFLGFNSLAMVLPDVLWSCWTILGDTWMVLTVLALCLWWQPQALLGFALAVPLGGAVSRLTKVMTQIPRPAGAIEPSQFHIVGPVLEFHSFPSGHTLSAFALLAVVLAGRRWGVWGWLGLMLAMGVGLSRMAVGAHWPADVLAGAALGWVCGTFTRAWGDQWLQRQSPERHDRTLRVLAWVCLVLCAWAYRVDTLYPLARGLQSMLVCAGVLSCAVWLWRARAGHAGH